MDKSAESRKIYFCGSICGGREDQAIYKAIIDHLKTYGEVPTEVIGDVTLTDQDRIPYGGEKALLERSMKWFHNSDVVVAEVTRPSLGVGYELGYAVQLKKKTLCLFRQDSNRRLSCMIQGSESDTFIIKKYTGVDDAIQIIEKYFKEHILDSKN